MKRAEIEAAAARGDPAAQLLLAQQLANEGRGEAAVVQLARATRTGHAHSFALFGVWQLLGYNLEKNVAEGMQRLEIAARHGEDTAAAFLASVFASGLGTAKDWTRALDWLIEAARLGNARALVQIALLQPDEPTSRHRATLLAAAAQAGFTAAQQMKGWRPASAAPTFDPDLLPWAELRAMIDIPALIGAGIAGTVAFESPRITTYRNFANADWCRYVMAIAEPQLERAMVNEPRRGRSLHEMRTNSDMTIGPTNGDPLLQIINERLALLAGMPVECQENSTVLRYQPGERYDDHFDFFNPEAPQFREEIRRRGQRDVTALVYLSSDFEGGETEFPKLGWRFSGRQGDAIVWRNVKDDGSPEALSLHAGRPPMAGTKWVLSKWIRSQPQDSCDLPERHAHGHAST